jgi:hypothetical protein
MRTGPINLSYGGGKQPEPFAARAGSGPTDAVLRESGSGHLLRFATSTGLSGEFARECV